MRALVLGGCLCLASARLYAQDAPTTTPRFEFSIGPDWQGAMDLGGSDARETANGTGTLLLFRTASELRGGIGVSGSLGVRVTGGLWAETSVRYHSSRLVTVVSDDVEGAAETTAREPLQQIQIEGGALWAPDAWQIGRHLQAYASGGGGYLRQLHDGQTLVETGATYYLGGGMVIWLPQRQGGTFKAVGVRLDPRVMFMSGGVTFDDGIHVAPAVTMSLFVRF